MRNWNIYTILFPKNISAGYILFIAGRNTSGNENVTHNELCKCSVEINGTLQEEPCTEWQYDDSVFESTVVTQVMGEFNTE